MKKFASSGFLSDKRISMHIYTYHFNKVQNLLLKNGADITFILLSLFTL